MAIAEEVQLIFNAAYIEAKERKHEYLMPEHILFVALEYKYVQDLMQECQIDSNELYILLDQFLSNKVPIQENIEPEQTIAFQHIVERALFQQQRAQKKYVDVGDLIISIYDEKNCHAAFFLRKLGMRRLGLLEIVSHGLLSYNATDTDESFSYSHENVDETGMQNKNKNKRRKKKKSLLEEFTVDLVQYALDNKLDPLIGRDIEMERTIQILCRRIRNNPIHVGRPGVGKTVITEGLAKLIAHNKVPQKLQGMRIHRLDIGALVAGTRYRGDFEERIKKLLIEIEEQKNIILFIDEIHTVIGAGAGSGGAMDASDLLKPALTGGSLRVIGATTDDEYRRFMEKERALLRRFQVVDIVEPTIDEAYEIVQGVKSKYEEFHEVIYSDAAIHHAINLSHQFISERYLPDKAIDVIDECGAMVHIRQAIFTHDMPEFVDETSDTEASVVSHSAVVIQESDIEKVIAKMAKIPEQTVSTSERDKLQSLFYDLQQVIFGQNEAISVICEAIKRSRAGFRQSNKTIANFLFVGPTGVGKTELTKQLAHILGIEFIRIDMSEYQEKHSISRLIGSPPGYVGFEEGGLLTESIRRTPHAVLLLDEIEKAHYDIYNMLLQIMDHATLTDNMGRQADFRNVILIMTSNAGARNIGKPLIGFGDSIQEAEVVHNEIERIFSPEFRNRLDKVVVFHHLHTEIIENIVHKEIVVLEEQLRNKNVVLTVAQEVIAYIAHKGYSKEFGARNIIRVVDQEIRSHFIDLVLFGDLSVGGSAYVALQDNEIYVRINDDDIIQDTNHEKNTIDA